MPDNLWFYVALFAIFFIGVTKSGFGSGVGLIIVPLTALAMGHSAFPGRGESAALGLLLPLLVAGDFLSVYQHRKYFLNSVPPETPPALGGEPTAQQATTAVLESAPPTPATATLRMIGRLLPGTFLGVILGSLLLWWFHQHKDLVAALMRIEIGIESVLLVGLHWWRQYRGQQTNLMPEPFRSWITGTFAGASSTLAHAAGPIIAMYLLPLKLERKLFVATCALYFFILNSLKLPFYYQDGLFEKAELSFTLRFLPVVIAGALFGFWINRKMSDKLFTTFIYVATFLLGWYIMVDGIRALL
jgi:uncharacterized membrane protein YfcA